MRYLIVLFMLTLAACAKDDKKQDPFFRPWNGGAYGSLNLTGLHYGQNEAAFNGCVCRINVYGVDQVSQMSIRSCSPNGFDSSPECSALDGEYLYTYNGSSLELCEAVGGSCSVYY